MRRAAVDLRAHRLIQYSQVFEAFPFRVASGAFRLANMNDLRRERNLEMRAAVYANLAAENVKPFKNQIAMSPR